MKKLEDGIQSSHSMLKGYVNPVETQSFRLASIDHSRNDLLSERVYASFLGPILGDLKRPLEMQMCYLVIVDESTHGIVLSSHHHTRRSLLRSEGLTVCWSIGCVRGKRADHFLVLADWNTLALDLLNVLEA